MTELCDEFDVILGNAFFIEHRVVLDFASSTITSSRDGKQYKLAAAQPEKQSGYFIDTDNQTATDDIAAEHIDLVSDVIHTEQTETLPDVANDTASAHDTNVPVAVDSSVKPILSYAQAKRALRSNCELFFVMVTAGTAAAVGTGTTSGNEESSEKQPVPELQDYVATVREKFADVFKEPSALPPDRGIHHVIPLEPDSQPPFQPMYRLSPEEQKEVHRQIPDLLKKKLIEPSTSSYGSPILFVKKKSGELHMVIDYRALNKLTVTDQYPLPRIDDLLDRIHGARYFTSLDAASGFHQILLKDEDCPKTAFRTPMGQFKVLPLGLRKAPATFQAVMNRLFSQPEYNADGTKNPGHALTDFVLVFIDDILIFSKTAEDHKCHLDTVLQPLHEQKILTKASKCVWAQPELHTWVILWGGTVLNLTLQRSNLL